VNCGTHVTFHVKRELVISPLFHVKRKWNVDYPFHVKRSNSSRGKPYPEVFHVKHGTVAPFGPIA
jgi:hypothetical protein